MNDTVNRKALVEKLSEKTDITKKEGTEIVDVIVNEMIEALKAGNKVDISGFGKFEVKEKAAHQANNPATGEKVMVEAKKVVKFKPAKVLKETIK